MGEESAIPWGNVLFTLLIRFVGVFIVLGVLQIGLYASAAIVSKLLAALQKRSGNK